MSIIINIYLCNALPLKNAMFPRNTKLSFVFLLFFVSELILTMFIVDKGVLSIVKNSVGLRFYVDIENEDRETVCSVSSKPKNCCLKDLSNEDCDVFAMSGATGEDIQPKDRTTLIYVLPVLQQYDLVGHCDIIISYHCPDKRETLLIRIPFDTSIEKTSNILLENYGAVKRIHCETADLDSFNKCLPVDCERKYLGQRPFFDVNSKRCIEAPVCVGDTENQLPKVVYAPNINTCKDLSLSLSIQDIYAMSTGLGTVKESVRSVNDVKVELESNCSTISQNLYFIRDLMYGKFCPCARNSPLDFSDCCKSAIYSIVMCIISVCAVILSIVCYINTMLWLYKQNSKGNFKECIDKVKYKFKRAENVQIKKSRVNGEIRNALLREVLIKDIPIELRDSVVSICDRMDNQIRKKNRYRKIDIGSQISLQKGTDLSPTSSSTTLLVVNKDMLPH